MRILTIALILSFSCFSTHPKVHNRGNILTTGPLRFPQMILHLHELNQSQSVQQILILGAGLFDEGQRGVVSPMLHEIQALFPEATLTVVDNSTKIANTLSSSNFELARERAIRTAETKENFNIWDLWGLPDFLPEFDKMYFLSRFSKQIPTYLDMKQTKFLEMSFEEYFSIEKEPQFDVIVATKSLFYSPDSLTGFNRIPALLKPNGKLYIDGDTFKSIDITDRNPWNLLPALGVNPEKLSKILNMNIEFNHLMTGYSREEIQKYWLSTDDIWVYTKAVKNPESWNFFNWFNDFF